MATLNPREQRIVALKKQGLTYQQIVSKLNLPSHVTVYQALAKAGMTTSRGSGGTKMTDAVKAKIVALRKENPTKWTYMALAVEFETQPPVINKILRAAGLVKPKSTRDYSVELDERQDEIGDDEDETIDPETGEIVK